MKKLIYSAIITSIIIVSSISLSATDWMCPFQESSSKLEPAGTYACVGAPEEGTGCDCSAYCTAPGGGEQ